MLFYLSPIEIKKWQWEGFYLDLGMKRKIVENAGKNVFFLSKIDVSFGFSIILTQFLVMPVPFLATLYIGSFQNFTNLR